MALADVLLAPMGLLALLALLPVVLLYLVKPDPARRDLPTLRFLVGGERDAETRPRLARLRRNLLLVLQVLALVALALALAAPYVTVPASSTVEQTVLVVDGSASMGTETDGATRFARALDAARADVTGTTSLVVAGGESRVVLRRGGSAAARRALDDLRVTDAPGDLRSALSQAAAIADADARIVVYSDFADDSAWDDAVTSARARGLAVDLRQFGGGGDANVGIVGRTFSGRNVTVTVKSYAEATVERSVTLGDQRRTLTLAPGDVRSTTFTVPGGGGTVALTPGDAFPTDDAVPVAAPADPTVDVLLLTNDPDEYLTTALSVNDEVALTVERPPTAVEGTYDVVIYDALRPERLLAGNVQVGHETLARGGGVVVRAQTDDMPVESYGDLLIVSPDGTARNPTLAPSAESELTRGLSFPPPERYLTGSLREGRTLVATSDGTPLVAIAERGPGRVLYDGYLPDASAFKYDYEYPVFWKRAVAHLAGRESLAASNRETGTRLAFEAPTTVGTPTGTVNATSVRLDEAGYYTVGDRRYGAALTSESESAVATTPLAARSGDDAAPPTRVERSPVPRPLTGYVAFAALLCCLLELAYLRREGDL
ncbi:hypothetical protein J2752_000011 [Halarchaeum rubridurum]|uniref:N-terminal double-transmembrane domain-containing protein n=1 Tax=Halarchaeum rubridurum TaxID=489911 RepID=A0A830FPD5_9EURY|nr:VWA domain-containing protein [Halarchaeum rubridurum]MBP1953130.1 hypothetical protein [Halarchaeum rubridurum]GGM67649.1 hypothetical protein GCM10009017_17250 [Halarchaeum rubridurum]